MKLRRLLIILLSIFVILLIFFISAAVGNYSFDNDVKQEVNRLFEKYENTVPEIITEKHLEGLPGPVQRWLRYSQIIGKERAITVRLKQKGEIKTAPDKNWMPFTAEEYYTTDPPAFIWSVKAAIAPLLFIKGRDKYINGTGNMNIKLMSLFSVVDARGPELDQGTLLRFLNEIMWFPSAALNDYIKWEAVDSFSAKAVMKYKDTEAWAVFNIDKAGRLINMTAERFREAGGKFVLDKWSTPISGHKEFNGIPLPAAGRAVWHLPSGDFEYIKLELIEIEYNIPELYN